jgi:hypothetical protein
LSDDLHTPLIALAIFVLVLISIEIGYRYAQSRRGKEADETFGVVEGAAFSIVGLLLGFSFSLAVSHYDARRLLVVQEANAIGTTMLRSEMLPQLEAAQMRATLREYVDARIAFALADRDTDAQARAAAGSDRLQQRMWSIARSESRRDPRSTITPLFISTLNDAIDASGEEAAALNANIPDVVIAILGLVILAGSALLGYGFGKKGRHTVASVLFAAMLGLVVSVVLDLDQAQSGFIRVSLVPLRELQTSLAAPPP